MKFIANGWMPSEIVPLFHAPYVRDGNDEDELEVGSRSALLCFNSPVHCYCGRFTPTTKAKQRQTRQVKSRTEEQSARPQ